MDLVKKIWQDKLSKNLVFNRLMTLKHNRNDKSHNGKIGICLYCVIQDQEDDFWKTIL